MYRMKITGTKKAVLMTWASAVGYGGPDIQSEDGTDDEYTMVCESETRYDADPFNGEKEWNGEKLSLDSLSEPEIRDMECGSELIDTGLKYVTGCLGVDVKMVNIPDDDDCPVITIYHYKNGEELVWEFIDIEEDPGEMADSFIENPEEFLKEHTPSEGDADWDDDEDFDD